MEKLSDERFLERLKLAVGLRRHGYYREAQKIAMELVAVRPQSASVWHTLGQIWTELGSFDAALQSNQEAMRLLKLHGSLEKNGEQFQTIAFGLAVSLMRYGRFTEAWLYWEAGRLGASWSPWPGAKYLTPDDEEPMRSLLIQSEGGYGDTLMFLRWIPLLKRKYRLDRLGLMLWKPLVSFCDWGALGVDEVYEIDEDNATFDWQYATSIMSLPAVFGMKSWSDIPPIPTLNWQTIHDVRLARAPDEPFRIGICWRSEEATITTKTRSLPVEVTEQICRRLVSVASIPVEVRSLSPQKADLYGTEGFEEPASLPVEPACMAGGWGATAGYMAGMDFVLTVDTAVAHLAGLLGIPTLLLLPVSSDWRWGLGSASSWYGPRGLTYYRQTEPLVWDADGISKALLERIGVE